MKREMFKDRQIVVAQQNVKEKSFWLNQLSGPLVKSFIPYDFDSGKRFEKEYNVAVLPFEWTGQLFQGLLAQSGNSHYKLHIIMLAGIILLLDKYTGNRDIVVSTPIYRPDIEGKFINSVLPVRIQPGTQNTFKEMLKLVSKTVVEASENQNYPMEILLEQIGMPLIKGEPSLLDTAVVIENVHEPHHIRSLNPGIIFSFLVTDASIKGKIEYHSSLYAETTVERVIVHLKRILAKAAVNLDCPLSDLDIVSEEERYRLLNGFSHAGPGSGDTPAAFAPLPRQRIYIVDGYNHLQPQGLEGDVYFAGANVTGGVEDPFFPGDRMWKTGDIARWLPDGTIEFSGKEENRLIIRGCRIGPEKIEKHLLEIPYIKEAVVTTIETENNTPSLCAYIVSEKDLSASEWKEKLAGKLPDYLIPASLVRLEKMPLTPGGKIDRTSGALLENEARVKTSYISPRDIVEEKLTFIWSEILEMDKDSIRIDDNFSQLGGQSLQAIMMSSRIHKEFNISIPIPEIFELSTLLRFADYIRRTTETEFSPIVPVEKKEYYAISPAQKRLYLLQQIDIGSIGYNDPDIAGVEGSLDSESLEEVFKKLIKRHETLRTSFQIVENAPVQKIHNDIEFEIEYYEGKTEVKAEMEIVESFVRPFDLSQA
ncbi:MAG: AMP-binding protein, partial [bacterium]|nr:AMP-binding protein [bacterium]